MVALPEIPGALRALMAEIGPKWATDTRGHVRLMIEKFSEVLEQFPKQGIAVETSHGPGCLAVTGYRPEEYKNDPDLWHRMVHPDDTSAVVANAAEMQRGTPMTPSPALTACTRLGMLVSVNDIM